MKTSPALRAFHEDPIPTGVLVRAVEAARFAPSGGNLQPWRVIVVNDPAKRTAMRDIYWRHWQPYYEQKMQSKPSAEGLVAVELTPEMERRLNAANEFADRWDRVPLMLAICTDLNRLLMTDKGLDRPTIVGGASTYTFVQNLMLALRAEGLTSVLTTLTVADEPDVLRILGVPDHYALASVVMAAHSPRDLDNTRLTRLSTEEILFVDDFGAALETSGVDEIGPSDPALSAGGDR
ncbi:MAG: nitroreductase family protein [Ilumatobacter sp.]|uniref:nitroreductase family protein n=1 Tax=Ilumatobacter sp. TaxID=1967498 RepID=UPI00391C6803